MELIETIREYWDADAATYDLAPGHGPGTPAERAAWTAALAAHLPPPPARILDVGAGTGFLAIAMARLGHDVTALDLSSGMLARLVESAGRAGIDVSVVQGPAHEPPGGPFDAVTERHLLWTLPDPRAALAAWRSVAPTGRLLSFEGLWGGADPAQARRQQARTLVRRLRRIPPGHHAEYDPGIRDTLPLGAGTHPDKVVTAVEAAGWPAPRLERLRDVEWARLLAMPATERVLGTVPQYLVRAG